MNMVYYYQSISGIIAKEIIIGIKRRMGKKISLCSDIKWKMGGYKALISKVYSHPENR